MGKKRTREQKIKAGLRQPLAPISTPISVPENPLPIYIIKDLKKTLLIALILLALLLLVFWQIG